MTSDDNQLDWGADSQDLSNEEKIEDWVLEVPPANDKGDSDQLQSRISPDLGRTVDELIMEAKGSGIPLKTRSDFVRVAVLRMIDDLRQYIGSENETVTHWMVQQKLAQQEAFKMKMLSSVLETIQYVMKGLNTLSSSDSPDWNEVNKRLSDFLKPIMEMRVSNEFVAKLYVRELFNYPSFDQIFTALKTNRGKLSDTIEEAERLFKSE